MPPLEPDAVPHRALRIDVHHERLETSACEGGGEIHRGCRLADSTFLADDREHVPHGYGSVSSRAAPGSVPVRRSSRVCCACRTQRSASAPDGGCRRKASRCSMAPSASPFLSSRNASP